MHVSFVPLSWRLVPFLLLHIEHFPPITVNISLYLCRLPRTVTEELLTFLFGLYLLKVNVPHLHGNPRGHVALSFQHYLNAFKSLLKPCLTEVHHACHLCPDK